MRPLCVLLSLIGLVGLFGCEKTATPTPTPAAAPAPAARLSLPGFAVGQVWKYRTRPKETGSRVIIGKIETLEKIGPVVHVKLVGLRIPNAKAKSGFNTYASHIPITQDKLQESVTGLAGEGGDLKGFEEGYGEWRKAYEADEAGAFAISLEEVVDCVEQGVREAAEKQ